MFIVIGSLSVVIVAVLVGVLISVQRKRVYGTQWFPEGFFGAGSAAGKRRKGPDGREGDEDAKLDGG